MQPGKSGVVSLYFSNCSESIDTHYRKMAKNVFSKLGVFLIAISLYSYIIAFCTVSAKTA
ncbi:hypothetical protein T4B_14932 [Trichinella pseudospiralis]|uniref:Uncharacterized protein n=1 Tax=Trichinella pseudospiralis TaxID=6337 RepID=A0A0V1GLM4_TRIPS|nr:hypothetical protein T4C_12829 [Trichinella pseudospiralis]KRY99174.1 hypothetical protein T4B_14932 [Trichinella pseudospiralis]